MSGLTRSAGVAPPKLSSSGWPAIVGDERLIVEMLQDATEHEVIDGVVVIDRREQEAELQRQRRLALERRIVAIRQGTLVSQMPVDVDMVEKQRRERAVRQVVARRRDRMRSILPFSPKSVSGVASSAAKIRRRNSRPVS